MFKPGLLVACVVAVCCSVPSLASAATCDYWQGPSGGDWATAGNWSGGVPLATTNVCLDNTDASGSYTVDIDSYNPALVANSITIGGSAGNVVTLAILGTGGGVQVGNTLTLTNQDAGGGVTANGAITLGSLVNGPNTAGQPGDIVVSSGTLVNAGTITSEPVDNPAAYNGINGSLDNVGTLNLDQNFAADGPDVSSGAINIASGITARFDYSTSGASFTQTGGTIANQGTFEENDGTFVGSGGTSTGNPLELTSDNSGITVSPSGTGTDSLHIQTGAATLGSSIGRGYTVWASGEPGYSHGNLTTASGPLVNTGTLELGSIDGTHGTLTIPSGSFINDGTIVFENTANGPDGLNGTLVNNGVVSVPNGVQGTGQIINDGTFSLTAGTTFAATSYSQGSGGTLSLAITGGATPSVPELQLTGAAQVGGKLAVATSGTATGTFPVISDVGGSGTFASTALTGESYSVAYTSTGVSLTGPAASTPKPTPVLHIGKISGGTGKLTVSASCSTGSGACSSASIKATVVEHFKKGKLTAVTASKKTKTKTVTIASGTIKLAAGQKKTLTLTINGSGKALLAKYGKLSTDVTVTAGGKKLAGAKVTVHKAAKKKKKK